MVTNTLPAALSLDRQLLHSLMQKIAQLSEDDREQLMPDLIRLQNCLDENDRTLQESLDRFQILADSNPLLIWMTDAQGGNQYINQTYRDFIGVSLEEVRGFNWQKYLHPDDAPGYTQAYQQAVQEQREFREEVRVLGADGAWRWIVCFEKPHFTKEGKFLGYIGNGMDITNRKQAEEVVQETLRRAAWLARLPHENPDPVARMSRDGQVLYHNLAAADLPGWSFQNGKQVPETIQSLVEQAFAKGEEIKRDIPLGGRDYSITIMPFPEEEYANLYGTDITERRRAEQAQQLANAQLRFYRDSNLIGVVIGAEDGSLVEVNDYYLNLLGYTREEFQAGLIDWRNITPLEHLSVDERAIAELKEQGICNPYEKEYYRKDGSRVWVYLRDVLLPDKKIGAIVLDINERKRTEEALARAHADLTNERNRLLAVMDALPIALAILDKNGGLIQANPSYEAVWGTPRPRTSSIEDYELYKAWWVETGQRVQPEEWASSRAVQNGETTIGQFIEIQKFDGAHAYIWNSAAPIYDSAGQIAGAVVTIMDVTERIGAERALQESQERFRVALASVPLMVFTCNRDLRYTWVYNPLAGFAQEDIRGKRDDEILPPEAAATLIAIKQEALETGQGSMREVRIPMDGQSLYYILTTEPILNTRKHIIGLTCSAIDITEQKLLEIEQQENEMQMEVQRRLMEYREKERQEIARDMHDGPIQMVSGTIFHLQVVKEAVQDPLMKIEMEQATLNLKGAVRELRDIMNELRPPAVIQFGLTKTARIYVEDFRERYPELKLSLQMFDDGDLLPEHIRLALFRIFQESLNNIAKHANASRVWVRLWKKGDEVHLRIRDNGKGFEVPADLAMQTQRGHYGLAGMKERAEAMGGRFVVSSKQGDGTTTLVVVPL